MASFIPPRHTINSALNGNPLPFKKPTGPLKVDWSNPLTKDLIFAWLAGNENRSLIDGSTGFDAVDGTPDYTGGTIYVNADASEGLKRSSDPSIVFGGNGFMAVAGFFYPSQVAAFSRTLYVSTIDLNRVKLGSYIKNIDGSWTVTSINSSGSNATALVTDLPVIQNSHNVLLYNKYNGVISAWRNGEKSSVTTSTTLAGIDDDTTHRIELGHYATTYAGKFYYDFVFVFRNGKDDGAAHALASDPYQILKPINDSAFLFGASATGGVTGTISTQESGSDSLNVSGDVLVSGQLALSETGQDVSAIAGNVLISGQFAVSETGLDSASLSGAVSISGQFAIAETGADQLSFDGNVIPAGNWYFSLVESGIDSISLQSNVLINGSANLIESGSDVLSFFGSAPTEIIGTLSAQESNFDSISFAASVFVSGSMALNESGADIIYLSQLQDVAKLRSRKRRGIKYYSSRPARVQ